MLLGKSSCSGKCCVEGSPSFALVEKEATFALFEIIFIIFVIFRFLESYRSSSPEVFYKKGVLKYFEKLTGKHLRQSLFLNNVADQDLQLYQKRESGTELFEIFKNTFLYRTPLAAASDPT